MSPPSPGCIQALPILPAPQAEKTNVYNARSQPPADRPSPWPKADSQAITGAHQDPVEGTELLYAIAISAPQD